MHGCPTSMKGSTFHNVSRYLALVTDIYDERKCHRSADYSQGTLEYI